MTDDEFLNDRDCTPKGDTPRTDAASRVICGHAIVPQWIAIGGAQEVVSAEFARELERELARALRVVEAAQACAVVEYPEELARALREWEAGR